MMSNDPAATIHPLLRQTVDALQAVGGVDALPVDRLEALHTAVVLFPGELGEFRQVVEAAWDLGRPPTDSDVAVSAVTDFDEVEVDWLNGSDLDDTSWDTWPPGEAGMREAQRAADDLARQRAIGAVTAGDCDPDSEVAVAVAINWGGAAA